MNNRTILGIGVLLLTASLLVAGMGDPAPPMGTRSVAATLTAALVDTGPTVDGTVDSMWADASPVTAVGVTIKAAYTSTDLYVLATWDDTTESDFRKQWTYDTTTGAWNQAGRGEDRLAFAWNLNNSIADFTTNGCMSLCHSPQMRTNGPTEKADVWHWKATRTNAAGYADDKWFRDTVDNVDPGASRPGDAKTSGSYKDNKQTLNNTTADVDVPIYWEPTATGADVKFILASEIAAGETLGVDQVLANNTLLNATQGVYLEPDASTQVPGYYLERPVGSRGDVEAAGVWSAGKWTLEMSRPLVTGNDDDLQFDDTGETAQYHFGVATFDNQDADEHSTSGSDVYALVFEQPNFPPTSLSITTDIDSPKAGDEVTFNATANDPEGAALTYSWDFGDNSTGTGAEVTHTYADAGTYTVTLTVSDGVNTAEKTTTVTVAEKAVPGGLDVMLIAILLVVIVLVVVALAYLAMRKKGRE